MAWETPCMVPEMEFDIDLKPNGSIVIKITDPEKRMKWPETEEARKQLTGMLHNALEPVLALHCAGLVTGDSPGYEDEPEEDDDDFDDDEETEDDDDDFDDEEEDDE